MAIISANELLSIKKEDDYGVDQFGGADPTTFLAPIRDSVTIKPAITEVPDASVFGLHATRKSFFFGDLVDVSFSIPLTGKGGSAGTAPEYGAIFQAAGLIETVNAGVDVQYSPNAGAINAVENTSFSLVHFMLDDTTDGTSYEQRVIGVRGNWTIEATQNEIATLTFTGQGIYSAPPTATSTTPTLPTDYQAAANQNFMVVQGVTNTIGGNEACFRSATFDWGMNFAGERCANGAGAVDEIYLHRSGNPTTVSYELKSNAEAVETWIGDLATAATYALVFTLTDGTDSISITAPVYQPTGWTMNTTDGRKTITLDASLHGDFGNSNGGDNILLTYT